MFIVAYSLGLISSDSHIMSVVINTMGIVFTIFIISTSSSTFVSKKRGLI